MTINTINTLNTINDHCKSFYGKAYYTQEGQTINLYSYNTLVLQYDINKKEFLEVDYYPRSKTTARHKKEFMYQINNNIIK